MVLGTQITITFDQLIDTTTIDESTFSVTGPGQTQILTAGQLIAKDGDTLLSREYIEGTFAFDVTPAGASIVSFVPKRHFQPNVQYQVLLLGLDEAELSGRLAAEAVSIGAFERSRWRLRRTRSELWDFDLPLLVVARRCRNEASLRKPLGCICTMKWGPAGCPRGQDLRVDGGE